MIHYEPLMKLYIFCSLVIWLLQLKLRFADHRLPAVIFSHNFSFIFCFPTQSRLLLFYHHPVPLFLPSFFLFPKSMGEDHVPTMMGMIQFNPFLHFLPLCRFNHFSPLPHFFLNLSFTPITSHFSFPLISTKLYEICVNFSYHIMPCGLSK